jgi:hypothetical protein
VIHLSPCTDSEVFGSIEAQFAPLLLVVTIWWSVVLLLVLYCHLAVGIVFRQADYEFFNLLKTRSLSDQAHSEFVIN